MARAELVGCYNVGVASIYMLYLLCINYCIIFNITMLGIGSVPVSIKPFEQEKCMCKNGLTNLV